MLEKLAQKNADKVRILKVDVTQNREWAVSQKVRGIPTFQIYRNGTMHEQFAGGYPEAFLQKKIDSHAASLVQGASKDKSASSGEEAGSASESSSEQVIKPMPKDWLPPGVTRK